MIVNIVFVGKETIGSRPGHNVFSREEIGMGEKIKSRNGTIAGPGGISTARNGSVMTAGVSATRKSLNRISLWAMCTNMNSKLW